jgi:EAL domain-containing protein (putative c-di-GMP-specific phosphodiesterase class I)/GGDEF domain-containing protein
MSSNGSDPAGGHPPATRALHCLEGTRGLPGRLLFRDQLAQALRRAARDRSLLAVMALEISVADDAPARLDESLRRQFAQVAAARIARVLRAEDLAAPSAAADAVDDAALGAGEEGAPSASPCQADQRVRIGGFALLLGSIGEPHDAARVCARIDELLREPLRAAGHELQATARTGIAIYPWDDQEADGLLRCADEALARAGRDARPALRFHSRPLDALAADRLALERGLREALEANGLVLHWQARVDGESRRITGAEALLRWQPPTGELVPPGAFLDLAEQSRLILPIGDWVLREACRQARAWQDAGLGPLTVSVNISTRQFRSAGFVAAVAHALALAELAPERLELEFAEAALAGDPAETLTLLRALAGLGVRLVIDAFGAGFSSMARLREWPLHALRIDRSFVADLERQPGAAAAIGAIVDVARRFRLDVSAVGVEDEAQRAFLLGEGCRQMQGFLFGRPLSAAAFEQALRAPPGTRPRRRRLPAVMPVEGSGTMH